MRKVCEVYLVSSASSDERGVELTFPVSQYEMMDAFEQIHTKSPGAVSYKHLLESFDRYELLQFNAAVERFGLSAADELIDLSFCAREVTVVSDFTDLEKTGKRHYLTVHGACDSEALENLDGKETALALISGQPGYVTRFGVVYDNGIKLEQAYDLSLIHISPSSRRRIFPAAPSAGTTPSRGAGPRSPCHPRG